MARDYILGNLPTWAAALIAAIAAQDWNALYIPIVVGVISAISFAYKAAANRADWKIKKHESHIRKCESIAAQQEICDACKSGHLVVDCDFEHRPHDCKRKES